jgi:hypothetical protein
MSDFNIDEEFDGFGANQHVGPNPLIAKLQQAFRSEVHAPTILPYERELVDQIRRDLESFTDQLENYDETMDDSGMPEKDRTTMHFWRTLMLMDLERVRYSLTRYLRCRLKKIENSLEFIARDVDTRDRLSEQEEMFFVKLYELKNNHFKAVVFDKLTSIESGYIPDYRLEHATPNEKEFVFARVLKNIYRFEVGDGVYEDFEVGMIIICQYSKIKEYVEKKIDERELELI